MGSKPKKKLGCFFMGWKQTLVPKVRIEGAD